MTKTGMLRIADSKDNAPRGTAAPRSVVPPAGDAPRHGPRTGPVVSALVHGLKGAWRRIQARAPRLGADDDSGYAPWLCITPASVRLRLVILWSLVADYTWEWARATATGWDLSQRSGAETMGPQSVARCRPTALSRGDGFEVRARSFAGLLTPGRHMSHFTATTWDIEPDGSGQQPVEPANVLDQDGADHEVSWTGRALGGNRVLLGGCAGQRKELESIEARLLRETKDAAQVQRLKTIPAVGDWAAIGIYAWVGEVS